MILFITQKSEDDKTESDWLATWYKNKMSWALGRYKIELLHEDESKSKCQGGSDSLRENNLIIQNILRNIYLIYDYEQNYEK